ncbi:hydratase [Peptoniphilus sp. MSJ-1]|uniref:Hydratase n=1 Tax=Peptoniphilus ovalis TaxID=2841503 RepID=A0ABS6FG51_9FIRM|nr:hydratase [Peptoniphilus ovalis]MBU5669159.1 hydratase [Peptoniphilus ovalis]
MSKDKDKSLIKNTISYRIIKNHNYSGNSEDLNLKFDALVSPDNNYVSILQSLDAIGIKKFPIPYVLSNCHNSLGAVGGTNNEDDHMYGIDNAKKYGGIFIPPYKAILHQFMREEMAGCGKMILGSDSHTRYGALGTMGFGEGGGEIVKQVLGQTYEIKMPKIIAIKLTGKPKKGIGPMDLALTIIGKAKENNILKNNILEFIGDGIKSLSMDFRMGTDVMTTESGALSSIWKTDEKTREYLELHGREDEYKKLEIEEKAYYDGFIEINLYELESMMALPFHPSNVVSIKEFNKNPRKYLEKVQKDIDEIKEDNEFKLIDKLDENGFKIDQALISGCAGGIFENISQARDILKGFTIRANSPPLGIHPASQPVFQDMVKTGVASDLMDSGVTIRPTICGPCFGVTDVPSTNQISIRHVIRNFRGREGNKLSSGQIVGTILMDARSIAATIRNNGYIIAATDLDVEYEEINQSYNINYYKEQVLNCYRKENFEVNIRKGPNITDWPEIPELKNNLILKVIGNYKEVTTDDLSPSADAVTFRSNPLKLAEFTMINKDKNFVEKSKKIKDDENLKNILKEISEKYNINKNDIGINGVLVGNNVGDGSSREQAASSQKILGIDTNIAGTFATKRYRSNLINWGILPIISKEFNILEEGDVLFIENVYNIIENSEDDFEVKIINKGNSIISNLGSMTEDEKEILKSGCLINYNRRKYAKI